MTTAIRSRLSRWDLRYTPYLFVAPFFVLFLVFGLFPLVYTAWVSMHDWSLLGGDTPWVGFGNYAELLTDGQFWNAMLNTLGMFVLATVPQLTLATVLAQLLNHQLRARTFWRMGVLLPTVTSVAAVGIIFTMMFSRDYGLVNWLLGHVGVDPISWQDHRWSSWLAISVMVDWRWTGFNTLILLAALQSVPGEIYEAYKFGPSQCDAAMTMCADPLL